MHLAHTVVIALVALGSITLPSQSPPDFSGTWTMDLQRSESPHQGDGFSPSTYVITQTAADVTIETRRGTAREVARYPISAAPPASGAAAIDAKLVNRAYWSGPTLVTEGLRTVQGQTISVRESRTLNADGGEMTLKTLLVVQHGYTLKGAQNYGSATDVYRRVAAQPQ